MYQKKFYEEKHADSLLIGGKDHWYYVLIKDFNIFMYDYALHRGRKHFLSLLFTSFLYRKNIKMSN